MQMFRLLLLLFVVSSVSQLVLGIERTLGLDQVALIAKHGYDARQHFVTTSDGFILSLFHIVPKETVRLGNRKPVLLQAGLVDSSKSLLNLEADSLGLMLVERGFDVWVGNNRGNAWSRRHLDLDFEDSRFWKFSWDQMGQYDFPATVEYVLNFTRAPALSYVGHSQGTTQVFAALSDPKNKGLAKKIDVHVALAPVAFLGHMRSMLLDVLADTPIPYIVEKLGVNDFGFTPDAIRDLFPEICEKLPEGCDDILATGFGPTKHILKEDYEVFVTDWPSGTSVQNVFHFIQMYHQKGKFQKFDFGKQENLKRYNASSPPQYDLDQYVAHGVKTAFFSGTNDYLANTKDVALLREKLRDVLIEDQILDGYAHMDFLWARDASTLLYPKVIDILDQYTLIEDQKKKSLRFSLE